eukprot:1651877-Rhodomonas_salina.1
MLPFPLLLPPSLPVSFFTSCPVLLLSSTSLPPLFSTTSSVLLLSSLLLCVRFLVLAPFCSLLTAVRRGRTWGKTSAATPARTPPR